MLGSMALAVGFAVMAMLASGYPAQAQTSCKAFCLTVDPLGGAGPPEVRASWGHPKSADAIAYVLARFSSSGVAGLVVQPHSSFRDPAPDPVTCYLLIPVVPASNPFGGQITSSYPLCYVAAQVGQVPLRFTAETGGFCTFCPVPGEDVTAERTAQGPLITLFGVHLTGGADDLLLPLGGDQTAPVVLRASPPRCYFAVSGDGGRTGMICSLLLKGPSIRVG